MKIKMLDDAILPGYFTLKKGEIYSAKVAYNQPGWKKEEKIFAEHPNGNSILLVKGDYEIVEGDKKRIFSQPVWCDYN